MWHRSESNTVKDFLLNVGTPVLHLSMWCLYYYWSVKYSCAVRMVAVVLFKCVNVTCVSTACRPKTRVPRLFNGCRWYIRLLPGPCGGSDPAAGPRIPRWRSLQNAATPRHPCPSRLNGSQHRGWVECTVVFFSCSRALYNTHRSLWLVHRLTYVRVDLLEARES